MPEVVLTPLIGRDRFAAIIGGRAVPGKADFDASDPATGKRYASVARGDSSLIEEALSVARDAFERRWSVTPIAERGRMLGRVAEAIKARQDFLAEVESVDTGKPLRQALNDVAQAVRYFEFYSHVSELPSGEILSLTRDELAFTIREPYGVTGHIIPWNYPIQMTSRTVAPALLAGNCCVVKPAEEACITPLWLGAIALEAGLPPGVLNIVPGFGEEAGAALAASPAVDRMSFSGSVEVGISVATSAAKNLIPTTLELGGKSPNIVFEDADVDRAVPVILNSILQNAGQTCSAGSRLIVHESLFDAVMGEISSRMKSVRIGRGLDDPDLGPLISERQLQKVETVLSEGSRKVTFWSGGSRASVAGYKGWFFEPTLLSVDDPSIAVAQKEIFGPVLVAIPFAQEEDAISIANGTEYGLVAGVWTESVRRAHSLVPLLQFGQVFVNGYGASGGVTLPFGGVKHSGYGREKGVEALRENTRVKTVHMSTGRSGA